MIRDLTCLNPCVIESRMQENEEELEIFLQNMLNFFTFNQVLFSEESTLIHRKFNPNKSGPFFSLKEA